jgi:hypothetical protein
MFFKKRWNLLKQQQQPASYANSICYTSLMLSYFPNQHVIYLVANQLQVFFKENLKSRMNKPVEWINQ